MAPIPKRRKFSHHANNSGNSRVSDSTPAFPARKHIPKTADGRAASSRPSYDSRLEDENLSSDDEDHTVSSGVSYQTLLQSFGSSIDNQRRRKPSKAAKNGDHIGGVSQTQSDSEEIDEVNLSEHSAEVLIEDEDDADSINLLEDREDDDSDPFIGHYENSNEELISSRLRAVIEDRWISEKIKSDPEWRISMLFPDTANTGASAIRRRPRTLSEIHLKQKLLEAGLKIIPNFDPVQAQVAPVLFNYADLLYGARSAKNADSLRNIVCVHALNHVLKTRDRIIKNTARLAKEPLSADAEIRDQGFTRPKILILLETRQSCVRYLDTMTSIFEPEQQENKKRFQDSFVQSENRFPDNKPEDFIELFQGNDDNDFRIGIKLTRKTMKYYSQFYASDIILASPLGLRRAVKPDDPKATDHDFLSSIEILIIDQADAMLMQNWEHVGFALDKLNLQPREPHGCDFSRVRKWSLDQHARYLRQTIVMSAFLTPELNSLYSQRMLNVTGKVKIYQASQGSMLSVNGQTHHGPIVQTFTRFTSPSPSQDPDARFTHFINTILPSLLPPASTTTNPQPQPDETSPRTVLFIPSYLDYTRLRNHLTNTTTPSIPQFASITEYTSTGAIARARSHFLSGAAPLLLYTQRAHHFRRFRRLNGASRVVFYGLPANPAFYAEVASFLDNSAARSGGGDDGGVRVLFSRWDALALERVVGSERVAGMLGGAGDRFEFR